MERRTARKLSEDDFVVEVLNQLDEEADPASLYCTLNANDEMDIVDLENFDANDGIKKAKQKRRSNLTEFTDAQTTKRKNESAKRELSSIVKQLGKIDKQLNSEGEEPRASINFIATFNSFKSNRISTFKYPADAEVKPILMNYESTMSAVKVAVQEAINGLIPRKVATAVSEEVGVVSEAVGVVSEATELFVTPTKAVSSFTVFPSPVTANKVIPTSSKNLCARNSCTFGKRLRKPVWVKCSHRTEGQSCNYWVHAPCIGFPGLKAENVNLLDGWSCPDHTELQMKQK